MEYAKLTYNSLKFKTVLLDEKKSKEINTNNILEQLIDIQHKELSKLISCKPKLRILTLFRHF